MRDTYVTTHAIRRWLERVRGVMLPGLSDDEFLAAVYNETGITRDHLIPLIKDAVASGVRYGASAVVLNGYRYVLRDNHVITIVPVKCRPQYRRIARSQE